MKTQSFHTTAAILLAISALLFSCDKDENSDSGTSEIIIDQSSLNGSIWLVESGITGDEFGGTAAISHAGDDLTSDQTIRDVYANKTALSTNYNDTAEIITKRVYLKDSLGNRGDLLGIFAMVKQPEGYFTDGGDWEYIKISVSDSLNTTVYPNGILPTYGSETRGKLISCASCHVKADGGNFLFVK